MYDVLHRFAFEDPDGNGEADTIAYGASNLNMWSFDDIFAAFGHRFHWDYSNLIEQGGMLFHAPLHPENKGAIRFLRKLYKDGLLDPEFAITSGKQERTKISSGKVGFYHHNWRLALETHQVNQQLWEKHPDALFVPIPPPKGPNGLRGCYARPATELNSRLTAIGAKSEHAEKAKQFLDYTCSDEGNMLTSWGVEGRDYTIENGRVMRKPQATELDYVTSVGIQEFSHIIANPDPIATDTGPIAQSALDIGYKYGTKDLVLYSIASSAKEYEATLKDIITENYQRMIVEYDNDLDTMWDKFVDTYMKNGGTIPGKEKHDLWKSKQ